MVDTFYFLLFFDAKIKNVYMSLCILVNWGWLGEGR